jgi:ElaB/YqjD/DUF883 family membrane-anchored ribosome-binding protein
MDTQTTAPQGTTGRADNMKQQGTQAASDVASTAQQEATQGAREAKDQVRELWGRTRSDLTDQAATQQTRVAGGLRELSDQLGSMAGAADQDGMAKGLVEDVARRADEAARWLDQRDPGSLLEEARSFARQRPGAFLAIAAGVGVLAGRLSRSLIDESRDSGSSNGSGTSSYGGTPATSMPVSSNLATPGTDPARSYGGSGIGEPGVTQGHRTTQPITPQGAAAPIDTEGRLTAEVDDDPFIRGER